MATPAEASIRPYIILLSMDFERWGMEKSAFYYFLSE
jgi:hypothetical protein